MEPGRLRPGPLNGNRTTLVTRLSQILVRLAPMLALAAIALVVSACIPGVTTTTPSGASPSFSQAPLTPANRAPRSPSITSWICSRTPAVTAFT